jgi:hypothetical protein
VPAGGGTARSGAGYGYRLGGGVHGRWRVCWGVERF